MNQSLILSCCTLAACGVLSMPTLAQQRTAIPFGEELQPPVKSVNSPKQFTLGSGTGMAAAADHILATQCIDGGWGWPWNDCNATYTNITGPIGLGLLHAYGYTADLAHLDSAIAGANFDMLYTYGNGEYRFSTYKPAFLYTLSQVSGDNTYSNFAETEFFDELYNGTYGPSDYNTLGWIQSVQAGRTGTWVNLRPWEFSTLGWTAGIIGNTGQKDLFNQAILDGLNTLDNTDLYNVYSDIIGLAGGVRGLALNGTTSFTAINAPKHALIDGKTTLCQLADVLAGLQNGNGSWYWGSALSSPDYTDEDTQTTAYAILALIEAQAQGCGTYTTNIDAGRAWLWTMQDNSDGGFFSYPTGDKNNEVIGEATNAALPLSVSTISLVTDSCNVPEGTLIVNINMTNATDVVEGGQFFLEYNNTVLDFDSADPGDAPFTLQVYESVNEGAGTIDYAVGVPLGGSGTMSDTKMAVLTFDILTTVDLCELTNLVQFRWHSPPSRLTDDMGQSIGTEFLDVNPVTIDSTPPVFDTFPGDITENADAGGCDLTLTLGEIGAPTASDACGGPVVTTWIRSDGATNLDDPFTLPSTTITWKITDECAYWTTQDQTVNVNAYNTLQVDVELQATVVATPFDRCIRFELFDTGCGSSYVVNEVMTFTNGLASATLNVPCGSYECITAQDELHTLRRTDLDHFGILTGTPDYYSSDFTTAGTNDSLIGGNFLNDEYIDILDFGVFVGEWAKPYGTGNTDCSTAFPHADASGNGSVGTEDYTFIATNFLLANEDNCCGLGPQWDNGIFPTFVAGPVVSITVAELERRGLNDLVVADLNNDGILNLKDIRAFLNGDRP